MIGLWIAANFTVETVKSWEKLQGKAPPNLRPRTQKRYECPLTRSEVGANYHRPSGRPVELTNYPAIEYEYSVAGQSFTGRRISIGEDTGGANTEATLAHYPLGATVMLIEP